MKMKHRLILAATLSAGPLAQGLLADDQPGSVPAPANPSGTGPETPAPSTKKKKAAAKKATTVPKKITASTEPAKAAAPVVQGPAIVSFKNPSTVNVRGQPAINSEVVVRMKRGDHVNVLEVIEKKAKENEPAKWAKVSLPTNAAVWVNASFIN